MTTRSQSRDQDRVFLGSGWAFPVGLDSDGSVVLVDHEEDIRQAIRIILDTNLGERLMRPEFGSGLREFVFESISVTSLAVLRRRVEEALTRWEARIDVERVETSVQGQLRSQVDVLVDYRVRSTNTFYNLVYPFYLDEASLE